MPPSTSHHTLPAFPPELATAPLVSLSLAKLEVSESAESTRLFQACKDLGFFYLDMLGSSLGETIVQQAEDLNKLQTEFFSLDYTVKDQYGRDKIDPFFAYRFASAGVTHDGKELRNESYNIRKDDLLGNCDPLPRHSMITEAQPLLQSYATRCRAVIDLLLSHLETHLGLPPASLLNLHRIDHRSGDHIRFTQNPPQAYDESRAERGEHTDFGSITILFNWLGGLQIRTQPDGGVGEWVYVKPVPGSCIVNLGDAMVKFTGGILRSNIHRVVPPPGQQSGLTRNSLVFFSRPEDEVVLKRLKGGLIDAQPVEEETEEQVTSKDWVLRRAMGDLHGIFTHTGGLERKPHGEYVGSRVTPAVVV